MNFIYKNDSKILTLEEKNHVPYFEFPLLSNTSIVNHGFSTRMGGVSEGIFSSMNLSFVRGDDDTCVHENFNRISKAIGIKKENIVCSQQTHTTNVIVVGNEHAGNGVAYENKLHDVDGMITNIPELCLVTYYADCVPLYFVDVKKKVIGLSHSGWKGTVGKIGAVTIQKMKETYGCNPEDIHVAIGPSICQDCYEVSEDVIEEFKKAFPKEKWNELFYEKENQKYQLDLWKANEIIMLEQGILKEHLAITNVCTCCNPELLFSHRASNGKRGNLAAFLSLSK